jgi:glyoxylase I family protein
MRLHHVNFVSDDMPALVSFYRDTLGLEETPTPPLIEIPGYSDTTGATVKNPAAFLGAGPDPQELQLHLCAPDHELGIRYGMFHNPVHRGHYAFRCDDIDAVKKRLEEANVPYSDYGIWAVKGWYQIFFYDPVGNLVEVQQVMDEPAS